MNTPEKPEPQYHRRIRRRLMVVSLIMQLVIFFWFFLVEWYRHGDLEWKWPWKALAVHTLFLAGLLIGGFICEWAINYEEEDAP